MSWRHDGHPDDVAAFDAWSRAQRRRHGWRAGLTFFRRTSDRRRIQIATRHWPHLVCWSWGLDFARGQHFGWRAWTPGLTWSSRHVSLRLGFNTEICLAWQGYGWMPAVNLKSLAPRIRWNRGNGIFTTGEEWDA